MNARRLAAIDRYTLIYMALTLPLFLMVEGDARWGYLAVRVAIAAAILGARRAGIAATPAGSLLLDLYALPLFGFFYHEVGLLNRAFLGEGFLDDRLIAMEQALFGGQPARAFREAAPWILLSEYLHLGYVGYYFYLPALVAALLAAGRRAALRGSVATVGLSFYVGFVLFILIPVAGPYYTFEHLDPARFGTLFPRAAHWFVDRGSSVGTAFPSSHVSISVTVWIMAMRYHRGLALALAAFVPAMAAGAVYGGFHYLLDIAAGAVLGIAAGVWGHRLTLQLSGEEAASAPAARSAAGSTVSGA